MLNYIGVFLTFRCGMGCSYCLNTQGDFVYRKEIGVLDWWNILKDIKTREDLPITLQGGEPTMYSGFYELVQILHENGFKIDLLTNGEFSLSEFIKKTISQMFQRSAPYASIRFSFHKNTDECLLIAKVLKLQTLGYSVGIWGLSHPEMEERNKMVAEYCRELGIDFRMKEYLDATHGTYRYPDAITGHKGIKVQCFPSERLFAPDGKEFHCHHNLYGAIHEHRNPDGSMVCRNYGLCNPCDVKLKTNRLQESGHCSVRIEGA